MINTKWSILPLCLSIMMGGTHLIASEHIDENLEQAESVDDSVDEVIKPKKKKSRKKRNKKTCSCQKKTKSKKKKSMKKHSRKKTKKSVYCASEATSVKGAEHNELVSQDQD